MIDIALALDVLVPGASYRGSLTANTQEAYNAIAWEEEGINKPSWAEVLAKAEELDLANIKNEKKLAIRDDTTARCVSGFLYDGHRFSITQANAGEFVAMRTEAKEVLASNGTWTTVQWPTSTGEFYAVDTAQKMIDMSDTAKVYRVSCNNNSVAHQQAVDGLEVLDESQNIDYVATKAAVDAYDITTGWPS